MYTIKQMLELFLCTLIMPGMHHFKNIIQINLLIKKIRCKVDCIELYN